MIKFKQGGFDVKHIMVPLINAADVKQRLDELNRSSAVPFAFRIYATYIEFYCNGTRHSCTMCTVVDDKHVEYKVNGEMTFAVGQGYITNRAIQFAGC